MERTTHEQTAYELGAEHARNAASWVTDGNASESLYVDILAALDAGDPVAHDMLPREPNLSGEYADDLTPTRLWGEIVGYNAAGGIDDGDDGEQLAALCDAYEAGVSDTFQSECERILRAALA